MVIARLFSNSSVGPYAHHLGRTPTEIVYICIGRWLSCAIYIILYLGFQASEYFVYPCLSSRSMFPWNRSRTPQQNQFKISCTSTYFLLLLCPRVKGEGGGGISLCEVYCIFRFLLWCLTYILWPYFSQAGHSFHSFFSHIILLIKLFFHDCVDFRV